MMTSRTPAFSLPPHPPRPPRPRWQAAVRRPHDVNVNVTRSRGNARGSGTTGTTGLVAQNQNATTGMQTGTAIAIANARPAAGLLPPRNFCLGYEDLMNALMSFLVNTL